MVFYGLLALAFPLIVLTVVASAVLAVWRAMTLPRGGAREPVCERCGYAVAGVAGFTCPECGSDLREVGIITPRMEAVRRGSLAGAVLGWTVMWMAGAWVAWWAVLMFWSFGAAMNTAASTTTTWSQTLTPNTPIYRSVELDYDSDWRSVTSSVRLLLTLSDGHVESLVLDPGPMTVVGLEGGEREWSARAVELWFAESGLDMRDAEVAGAAAETARVVETTLMSPDSGYTLNLTHHTNVLTPTGGAATTVSSGAPAPLSPVSWVAAGAVGIGVYCAGIVVMVFRRRRLLRVGASGPGGGPPAST